MYLYSRHSEGERLDISIGQSQSPRELNLLYRDEILLQEGDPLMQRGGSVVRQGAQERSLARHFIAVDCRVTLPTFNNIKTGLGSSFINIKIIFHLPAFIKLTCNKL